MVSGIYLSLFFGPLIPIPVPQVVMDSLESAQVTTAAGQATGFQFSFNVSRKSEIVTTYLPAGFADPGNRIILVATVAGVPHVLMDGLITRQEYSPSNDPAKSTLTITGEDLTIAMDLDDEHQCYPGLPAEARVALICIKYFRYGIIPLPIPTVLLDIPNPVEQIPIQTGTDLEYIKSLADEAGYVFYIEPGPVVGVNVAYWGPEVRVGIPQPALNVNMDAQSNVESLSFTYDGLAKKQLTVNVTEPITKLSIPIPIPDIGLLRPPLALKPASPLRSGALDMTAPLNPIKAALLGLADTAMASDSITATGELDVLRYGHVLKARQLVSVRGAGLAYDGFYYVTSVTHKLKRGEYKQSFTLGRDGMIPLSPRVIP